MNVKLISALVAAVAAGWSWCAVAPAATVEEQARDILRATGVQGGVIVHLGCGDGKLTAALRASESFLVQGLDRDAAQVEKARAHVQAAGAYGPVAIDRFDGRNLPYIDNFANLVVAEQPGDVPADEIARVLCPNGVAYVKQGGTWTKTVKPRPQEIDEWTHYLHGPDGNAVARDAIVGPPRRQQWVGNPLWSRHHDHSASLHALVSAGGRIFYIMDEGSKASIRLPARWSLTARDAFNGTVLWKRPIAEWWNHMYPLKSGPAQPPRRLVAVGDRVYVTLGTGAPLSILDAATGKTLQEVPDTTTAEELLVSDGTIFALVYPAVQRVDYREESAHCWNEQARASLRWGWDEQPRRLMALDAATGARRWQVETKVVPLTLATDGRRLAFHDGEAFACLDPASGKPLWRSEPVKRRAQIPTGWSPRVLFFGGALLGCVEQRQLVALGADDGKQLWHAELHPSGHFCPEDVLGVDGLVWSGFIAGARPKSSGLFTGRDPRSGDVQREFPPNVDPFAVMHQRCYPSKATERFLIPSWIGIEFIDPRAKTWEIHHWVRGGCVYGIMPCNGLIYAPPHDCACYYQSKLCGFNALAPAGGKPVPSNVHDDARLEKGPADGAAPLHAGETASGDWPTYRHDAGRSGLTKTAVPDDLQPGWQTQLGGRLTPPVVAQGTLYTASIDAHALHALDAADGKRRWSFTAGARIDSPPTVCDGLVLFGSRDGYVYALRAADGALRWRFRAAPDERRLAAFEQVESVWPVHGSVLVQNGVLYAIAGRSMFLDGGLRLLRLDPKSGRKLSETVLDDKDPETGKNLQSLIKVKKMPVALPDVLSSDGERLYMRAQRFDLEGRRLAVAPEHETDQTGEGIHLFSPTGLLDDSWFHRSYWIYGKNAGEGWSEWYAAGRHVPYGRILVFDDRLVYGFARPPEYLCNSSVFDYRLFAAGNRAVPERIAKLGVAAKADTVDWQARVAQLKPEQRSAVDYKWIVERPPVTVRALVMAGATLFAAGPPNLVEEKATFGLSEDPAAQKALAAQLEAFEGRRGGVLLAVSANDGKRLRELKLDAPPVFDGMAAAHRCLYLSTVDGKVVCLRGKR